MSKQGKELFVERILLVKAFAESTTDAADEASEEEQDDDSNNDPDPEDRSALSSQTSEAEWSHRCVHRGALVTVGNSLERNISIFIIMN